MSGPVTTENLTPAPAPVPGNGWTPGRKALFLDRMAAHGNARAACRAVGLSAEAAYKLRRRDPLFARAWSAALVLARENGEQVLGERAIEGVEEQIYYRGELIGTRRRYDSRLLLAHLARLDRLAGDGAASEDAGRFDEIVACIADGSPAEMPLERDAAIEQAAENADAALREEQLAEHPELYDETLGKLSRQEAILLEMLEQACETAAEEARESAGLAWDERKRSAFAIVDACAATPPLAPPAVPRLLLAARATPPETPSNAPRHSFPCTLSTVSTSSLARALARPAISQAATPRSPWHR
jgi:hypothetical protein